MKLTDKYKNVVHSQYGEDGIIAEIVETLGYTTGMCADIGAWDGQHYSNVLALVEGGFRAVMIEPNKGRYRDLLETANSYSPRIVPVNEVVTPDNVRDVLERNGADELILLNIDTDTDDPAIWAAAWSIAAIACIEWNNHGHKQGWRLLGVAEWLGYRLIGQTNSNMIFLRQAEYCRFVELKADQDERAKT